MSARWVYDASEGFVQVDRTGIHDRETRPPTQAQGRHRPAGSTRRTGASACCWARFCVLYGYDARLA